jgi:hypothetical protein
MPLTKTGKKVLRSMRKEYGKKKGTGVFYASINKGRLKGMERKKRK